MSQHSPHRNITFRRLILDLVQEIRSQKPIVRLLGRPYRRSRRFIEIDLTYRCNLKCQNCNRSCTQAPSNREIQPAAIRAFIAESIDMGMRWERIRLLGGEPTLHRRFFEIIDLLMDYRAHHRPGLRIVVCTNGSGRRVNAALRSLPDSIAIKNTAKTARQRLFRPFNIAPIDRPRHRLAEFTTGCRILSDCGIGLTPLGYYPCAIAGGIDRIFGLNQPRPHLPAPDDALLDQLAVFCPLCGHFGFAWPTRHTKCSPTWEKAYRLWRSPKPLATTDSTK
jgi:hypothetical protein